MYVVARDFGFAPNPFHSVCTLATCKPVIRRTARVGDWIVGMGGTKLNAVDRCIFAMQVTDAMSFSEYWFDPVYFDKRPVRNGSRKMMLGDNIYYRQSGTGKWLQADSHHSQPDGSPDPHNVERDTSTDRILISRHFFYFGKNAPRIPTEILSQIGFANSIGHRVYRNGECQRLIDWLSQTFACKLNRVSGDPFQFKQSAARYSVKSDRVM
jgi:hypothetical protein